MFNKREFCLAGILEIFQFTKYTEFTNFQNFNFFKEIWFVSVMALMVLIILVAFVATVWVRRQRSHIKNLGHYNGKHFIIIGLHAEKYKRTGKDYLQLLYNPTYVF